MKRCLFIFLVLCISINARIPNVEWNGDPKYPVIVYKNLNANGESDRLEMGIYPELDYFLDWKNGFRSIHLMEGYEIMCYSYLAFQGERFHLSESSMNIEKEAGFRPLSMKVIKTKEPEACTNYINFQIPRVKRISDKVKLKAEEKFWDEANSFCTSCGEQIGIDYKKSGFSLKKDNNGNLHAAGTVSCLAYPSDTFFENQLNEANGE